MKFPGLVDAEAHQFNQLRMKLRRARQAAVDTATAYDAVLAEVRSFVERASLAADDWHASRRDEWHKLNDHAPKEAVERFVANWHHATLNLEAIGFDAATEAQEKILDELSEKP